MRCNELVHVFCTSICSLISGGIGFIGAGSDVSTLEALLKESQSLLAGHHLPSNHGQLPLGVGFLNWGASLPDALPILQKYRPAAVWFFAPHHPSDLIQWTSGIRRVTNGQIKIWIQVGTVAEALEIVDGCEPDVLVVQGSDAGGHGLNESSSIITLLPEVADAIAVNFHSRVDKAPVLVAAGGIIDGRAVVAASALGAAGVVMGTRYLAAEEAVLAKGYKDEVIRASDGGVNTVRTSVYDYLRGTRDWPKRYGGRTVINMSFLDAQRGMDKDENFRLYKDEEKKGDAGWGPKGRLTTYAGTGVGLVRKRQTAKAITEGIREEAARIAARDVVPKL